MTLSQAFAKRLTELLTKNNISKYRLEKDTGLTHSTLRHIFNSNTKNVMLSSIARVAVFFNMTFVEFFDSPIFNLENIDFE